MDNAASTKVPQHVAIIMDGNGRWAQKRNMARMLGHRQGAKAVEATIKSALENSIKTLSLFAFSTENWGRPIDEVESLWSLLAESIDNKLPKLDKEGVRVKFIGDLTVLEQKLVDKLQHAEKATASNSRLNLVIAINYSGRLDIVQAAKKISTHAGDNYDEAQFSKYLMTAEFGDIDLLIRTGGEKRLSNFMLWQSAYAELYFCDCKWPDFLEQQFQAALEYYAACDRKFGRLSNSEVADA